VVVADGAGVTVTHRISIRSGPEVTARHRFRLGARLFQVIAWRDRDDSLQGGDGSGDLAEAVLNATEQHPRLCERRVQRERSPGRLAGIVVSPLEVGRQSGAEVEARVPGIPSERGPKVPGRYLRIACRQRVPRGRFGQGRPRIDLGKGGGGLHGRAHSEPGDDRQQAKRASRHC